MRRSEIRTRSAPGWPASGEEAQPVSPSSTRAVPTALDNAQQDVSKAAIQAPPATVGIDLGDWNWKVVREVVQRRFVSELRPAAA